MKNPQHARAWAQVEAVSRQFAPLREDSQRHAADAGLTAGRRALQSRRRVVSGLASLATLGIVGWHYPLLQREWQARTADLRTSTGELLDTALADGSHVWLAPGTALDVKYSPGLRRLQLHEGEIQVQTATDPARDFVVDIAWAQLKALGTRFNVRLQARSLHLDVLKGAVQVRSGSMVRVVQAGLRVVIDAAGIGPDHPAAANADAWTRGLLIADQMPLADLVTELSRYRRGHLGLAPEVARLPVVGVFPLRDPDVVLAMLEDSLPVRVRQPLPWWTTLEAAP